MFLCLQCRLCGRLQDKFSDSKTLAVLRPLSFGICFIEVMFSVVSFSFPAKGKLSTCCKGLKNLHLLDVLWVVFGY